MSIYKTNVEGVINITYCDDSKSEIQIIFNRELNVNVNREVEILLEYHDSETDTDTDTASTLSDEDNADTTMGPGVYREWPNEAETAQSSTIGHGYSLEEIYDEYNRDFEQSCQVDMVDDLINPICSRKGPNNKTLINNSALCTGNMWGGRSPCDNCDWEIFNQWQFLLSRGRERTEEELERLARAQEEWNKIIA